VIEIKSTAVYPWFVQEVSVGSGQLKLGDNAGYTLISIVNGEGCDQVGAHCEQVLQFKIPGCESLSQVSDIYDIVGLEFGCFGDCTEILNQFSDMLQIDGQVTLGATQANCGAELVIDATDSISLEMGSYLSNYVDHNVIYVEGDYAIAYFKIVATSNIPVDHLKLLRLNSTVHKTDGPDEHNLINSYSVVACPAAAVEAGKAEICFSCPINDMFVNYGKDSILTIDIEAEVDIFYTSNMKRDTGLTSNYELHSQVKVVRQDNNAQTAGSTQMIAMFSLLFLALF